MKKLGGVNTALVTPFLKGEVDYSSIEKLVAHQLKNGVSGFVIHGTTGESPTLQTQERKRVFDFIRERTPKNCPLIVGTGSNSTEATIESTKEAARWGADAVLVVVPYYNKPPQRGLLEHFKAVASASDIPNLLYNVPSRTITALELDTIKKLSEHPNIVGIKEASGNIGFAQEIRKECGETFLLLSGDDGTYHQFQKAGGNGVISVASHIIPIDMIKEKIEPNKALIDLLFVEANPIPVKFALFLMGLIQSPELRLPLVTLSEQNQVKLRKVLIEKGIIK